MGPKDFLVKSRSLISQTFIYQDLTISGLLLHLQVRLKGRVSMKISMSILRQHSARNGQGGLLTQEKKLFSEVQLLNLSGESTRAGNIEVELGEVVAIPSRMMNH